MWNVYRIPVHITTAITYITTIGTVMALSPPSWPTTMNLEKYLLLMKKLLQFLHQKQILQSVVGSLARRIPL
jgi:hypothetical protein